MKDFVSDTPTNAADDVVGIPDNPEQDGVFVVDEAPAAEAGEDVTGKTPEEIETARLAAEALAAQGKTPEQIEADRLAAEAEGNKNKTPEELKAAAEAKINEDRKAMAAELKKEIQDQLLKDLGVDSVEELKKLKNPPAPETEEQKKARAEKLTASFHSYAVDNDRLSLQEINTLTQLSGLLPKDLVFADFTTEFRDLNKERRDEKGELQPVTDEEVKEAFEDIYHTEDTNPAMKKAGERALHARAKEITGPTQQKYDEAKKDYERLMDRKEKIPEFKTFIQTNIRAAIPTEFKYTVDGREFTIELDGKDFEEIEEKFKNDNVYNTYWNASDRQGLGKDILTEVQRQLAHKYENKKIEIANRLGFEAGQKSKVIGAKAPFEETPAGGDRSPVVIPGKLTPQERQTIRDGHNRIR